MNGRVQWPELHRHLIAILRGIRPSEAGDVAQVLFDAGFEAIEVPLNSPEPFKSIEIIASRAPARMLIGAGTVLETAQVEQLRSAGGCLVVSPNVDTSIIRTAGAMGMLTMPGVFTATEALAAVKAGASALKFFPASVLGPDGIGAIMAVLPEETSVAAVGGVADSDFVAYSERGINIFGLGSSIYKPGMRADEVAQKAQTAVTTYDRVFEKK